MKSWTNSENEPLCFIFGALTIIYVGFYENRCETANTKSAKNRSEKIFCTHFRTGLSHLFKILFFELFGRGIVEISVRPFAVVAIDIDCYGLFHFRFGMVIHTIKFFFLEGFEKSFANRVVIWI